MAWTDYFIPGAPVIVCQTQELPIGHKMRGFLDFEDEPFDQPNVIRRIATWEEYLATVRPEHREAIAQEREPEFKYFYEVSVD